MKKLFLFLFLAITFTSCSENSNFLLPVHEMEYRKIAYESLSDEKKGTLITDWNEAEINKGYYIFENNINWIVFNSGTKLSFVLMKSDVILINAQPLVQVVFNTKVDALLGPIALIIDPKTKDVIGVIPRY